MEVGKNNYPGLPHLGIYFEDYTQLLSVEAQEQSLLSFTLPIEMLRHLSNLEQHEHIKHEMTLIHDARELKNQPDLELDFFLHPWINQNFRNSEVTLRLFGPSDAPPSLWSSRVVTENVKLTKQETENGTVLHPNAFEIKLSNDFPIHVVYLVATLQEGDSYNILVTKNIVVFEDSDGVPDKLKKISCAGKDYLPTRLYFANQIAETLFSKLTKTECTEEFLWQISEEFKSNKPIFWLDLLYYTIWECDGKPDKLNYGELRFQENLSNHEVRYYSTKLLLNLLNLVNQL